MVFVGSGVTVVSVTSAGFTGSLFKVSLLYTFTMFVTPAGAVIAGGLSSFATIANVGLAIQYGSAGG